MVMIRRSTIWLVVALILVSVALGVLCLGWAFYLTRAHSSYENYYKFRGCIQQLERTDTYGICKTADNQTIKIVELNNRWYLDGDLPWGWHNLGW